jgi:hypothetical protein
VITCNSNKFAVVIFFLTIFSPFLVIGQETPQANVTFDFNDHTFNEKNDKIKAKPVGVTLTSDRFGNKESAVYILGNNSSYLNLGTSPLLKPKKATISLWVNLDRGVLTGRGYENNPIIGTKNSPRNGWYNAYAIAYDLYNKKFGACASIDSVLPEVTAYSLDTTEFNKWYHLVLSFDNDSLAFYVNGDLQVNGNSKQRKYYKGFETVYYDKDSVILGHTANTKNVRFSQGTFDDIQIFDRVLSDEEVGQLYKAPNPNKFRNAIDEVIKYSIIIGILAGIAFVWVLRYKRQLKKRKEQYEMQTKISELEIKVMKAQMNPHFIFNSMNTIQQFIMTGDNEKAQTYLAKFSKLLREILESNVNENLTVKEEVEILTHYTEMEAARFSKMFNYSINVDDRIDQVEARIPHLLIQPFVENAIWHGLLPKKEDRNLIIKFEYRDGKTIRCVIDDNGIGRVASGEKDNTFKKRSLALSFVKQRLELMNKTFQVDCSVEIVDKLNEKGENEGTKVNIILPLLK